MQETQVPGLGRASGLGSGNPLQYSCLKNPMDRRPWQTTVHGVAKSWTGLRTKHASTMILFEFTMFLHSLFGEGNGNPFQLSCFESPMDRGSWWATVHGVARVRNKLVTKPPPPGFFGP